MARLTHHDRNVRRSGVVLLIVMAMLALFAVVGLSFVFYADSEADGARLNRQSVAGDNSDVMPEKLMSYALGQLMFGPDPVKNAASKMNGFDLARSIYGPVGGTVPFNGLGWAHPDNTTQLSILTPYDGINVPYTAPDINNAFLATIDANGIIQDRSFYRNDDSLRPKTLAPTNPANPAEGDVRNIESANGVKDGLFNDAFWMDLNFPILTSKDGTRYKPLFAFTILDLDGRVNLGVVGNYLANYNNTDGTSRCGLGTWEINPAKVLTNKAEIANLFSGNSTARSRFGPKLGDAPDKTVTFPTTKFYAPVDYTGISNGRPTSPTLAYSQFPTYPGWTDLPPNSQHAAGFDYFSSRSPKTATDDSRLAPSNAEAILRWRDRGASALTSDLMRLLPQNLDPRTPNAQQILNLITPYSMSFDTAHLAPFFVNDAKAQYQLPPWQGGAANAVFPHNTVTTQQVPLTGGVKEFGVDFRSRTAGELRRINLNRGLTSYTVNQSIAIQDRRKMVEEIFERLVRVTGALRPTAKSPFQPLDPNDQEYRATRWLAQLAVNIVDYIDDDDIMTVFHWNQKANPANNDPADYVIGVELNRLLINEAYVSFDNDKKDISPIPAKLDAKVYRVNAWAELYNPMRDNASLRAGGVANLLSFTPGPNPSYRLLLAQDATGIADHPTGLPQNLLYSNPNDPTLGVDDWKGPKNIVLPGDLNANGFFLVGPEDTILPERTPTFDKATVDHQSPGMSSDLRTFPQKFSTFNPTLALQRLADPTLPENSDPKVTTKAYNPFITVDYFENIHANDNVKYIGANVHSGNDDLSKFHSYGRTQPLKATGVQKQVPMPAGTKKNEPQHTFKQHNAPVTSPFNAFYHLDRPLISVAEALHAPAVAPWMVTQIHPKSFSVYPAMTDLNTYLYRFLETVTVGDRSYNKYLSVAPHNPTGVAGAGRPAVLVPGKINLNTVMDKRVIEALFDWQSNCKFSQNDVDTFWNDLQTVRGISPIAGFSDYKFSRTTEQATIKNTMFVNLFQKMFQNSTGTNEYEKTEALRKIMNNITFTSNAFAVWVTVGFFEVDAKDNVTQEIGKTENRHVRHRMFAIVDRSQLVIPDVAMTTLTGKFGKGTTIIQVGATSGAANPINPPFPKVDYPTWQIRPGMSLTLNMDQANEEIVTVLSVNANTITHGPLLFDHNGGESVRFGGARGPQVPLNNGTQNLVLGHPGPQPIFNLREYSYVVPYYSIID